jgi:hypothetical protein
MIITRKSILTGVELTRDLNIDYGQYMDWYNGMPIQQAAPQLSADDREWMMTGITPAEWDAIPFSEDAKLIVVS